MHTHISSLAQILTEAEYCEIDKDYDKQYNVLREFWADINEEPPIENLSSIEKAKMWRVCGHFLSNYGRAKGVKSTGKSFQERGKDMLILAVDAFTDLASPDNNFIEQAAEAKCRLALCYWHEGEKDNASGVLHEALLSFPDTSSEIYLQIQIHRLIVLYYSEEFPLCLEIFQQIKQQVDRCSSDRLKAEFYNQAGIIFRRIENHDRAIECYNRALAFSKKIKSPRRVAQLLNNLAFAYNLKNKPVKSLQLLDQSLEIYRSLQDNGFIGNVLDTKANVQMSIGSGEIALQTIEESIELLQETGDVSSLVDAMWTKVEIFLSLDRAAEAIDCHCELRQKANGQIDGFIVENYSKALADRITVHRKKLPPSIIQFYSPLQSLTGLQECDYLLFIPADKAYPLKTNTACVVSVEHGLIDTIVLAVLPSAELVITQLVIDESLGIPMAYIVVDGEPLFDFEIVGAITSIAKFDERVLKFVDLNLFSNIPTKL